MKCLENQKLIFVLFVFLIFNSTFADWTFTRLTDNKANEYDAVTVVDHSGIVHIVYGAVVGKGRNASVKLFYTHSVNSEFSSPVRITDTPTGQHEQDPAVAIDNQGLHVSFQLEFSYNTSTLSYVLYSGTPAAPIEIMANGRDPSLAIDGNGIIHISFWGGVGARTDVYYTHNHLSNTLNPVINVTGSLEPISGNTNPSIAVDNAGIAYIAYIDSFESLPGVEIEDSDVSYTHNLTPYAADFIQPVRANPEEQGVQYAFPSLEVDDSYAHITYRRAEFLIDGRTDCYYTKLDRDNPQRPTTDDLIQVSFLTDGNMLPQAILAPDNKIHIIWSGWYQSQGMLSTDLYYATVNTQGEVSTAEKITDNNVRNEYFSMDMADDGTVHISYTEGDEMKGEQEVWYTNNASLIPSTGILHIANVDVITQVRGKNVNGEAMVTIVDENDDPVEGAAVSGVWSGLTTDSDNFISGADGSASCSSDKVNKKSSGYFVFTVTNVAKYGWTYDIDANVEDSDSAPWNVLNKSIAGYENTSIPMETKLLGNYPNPFNPETQISFQLSHNTYVRLKIYNLLGEEIRILTDGIYEAGYHNVIWNGKDKNGNSVPSGIYMYKIHTAEFQDVKQMVLIK